MSWVGLQPDIANPWVGLQPDAMRRASEPVGLKADPQPLPWVGLQPDAMRRASEPVGLKADLQGQMSA